MSCLLTPMLCAGTERGGPSVAGSEGYGSKLLKRNVSGQLGGNIETNWSNDGGLVTVTMNKLAN